MAQLLLPHRWNRQPQGPVQIDWENPLSRGLVIETGGHRLFNKRLIDGAVGQAVSTGTGVSVSHGRYGKALQFAGTQTTGAASFGDVVRGDGYSAATWQLIFNDSGAIATASLFSKFGSVSASRSWLIQTSSTATGLIWVAAQDATALRRRWDGSSLFTANTWTNLVLSWRGGSSYSCLVNGVEKTLTAVDTAATTQQNSTGVLEIACTEQGTAVTGSVALARMWNRGLSVAECQSISANPWQILQPAQTFVGAVVSAPSITRPNSDVTVTGWTGDPDNVTLYANIDETSPSDTDFIISPSLGASPGPAIFGLTQSLSTGTYNVRTRARRTGTSGQIRALLVDSSGTTVGTGSWQSLSASFTTYNLSVTTTGTAARVRLEVQ